MPTVNGTVKLPGLTGSVTVFRDERGVPHIEASTSHDLYMAQGYVTAQDRLWQMDMSRRLASGRLAEIYGPSLLNQDKFNRTFMMRQGAEASLDALPQWVKESLDAYSQGVNAYIAEASHAGKLPLEFSLLRYQPESWTPTDSVVIGKLLAYNLGDSWWEEMYYYNLRQTLGDELTRQALPTYPTDGLTIMPRGKDKVTVNDPFLPPDNSRIDMGRLVEGAVIPFEYAGSNNWVVSGKLTKSGKPLLANDPHLGVQVPAVWYQTHLALTGNDSMNVIGVALPGAPGVVIGHNDKIAWGITNTYADAQDLFIEHRNEQNPYQFEFRGQWEDAKVYKESIKVKGQASVPFEVVVTRHGPILTSILNPKVRPNETVAVRWTAQQATREMEAILSFGKARTWAEFKDALRNYQVPTQNFVFASVDGTIAYRTNGLIPIRARGDGLLPVPGWTGDYEWIGYVPFDKLPEIVNPPDGFIVTANNMVADSSYPYLISKSWAPPYRAERITELLKGRTDLTVVDMQRIQTDYMNGQAKALLPILLPLVEQSALTENERDALRLLTQWDYVDGAEQAAPLLYHLWYTQLTKRLFEPKLGTYYYERIVGKDNLTHQMLTQAARGAESQWLKDAGGLRTLAAASFKEAVTQGQALQGNAPGKWRWGNFHRLGPAHPIGESVAALGWFLNTRAYPVGGSTHTVGAMDFAETGVVNVTASWRQVVDLANISGNSYDILSPGQSGHVRSDWYQDQAQRHVQGDLYRQEFGRDAYSTGSKLVLQP